jgi:histidinol dehydrogenase
MTAIPAGGRGRRLALCVPPTPTAVPAATLAAAALRGITRVYGSVAQAVALAYGTESR